MRSVTVEFQRFGDESGILSRREQYIRIEGPDAPAITIGVPMDYRQFRRRLSQLRYRPDADPADVEKAALWLGRVARGFLKQVNLDGDVHLDIVTHAAELWAFPFEALPVGKSGLSARSLKSIAVTRRIRADANTETREWPDRPRILFVHAAITTDLRRELVAEHRRVLEEALGSWGDSKKLERDGVLIVREVKTVEALRLARLEARSCGINYVHLLAHGGEIEADYDADDPLWGVRLGDEDRRPVEPRKIVQALGLGRKDSEPPFVVTLAMCDSANQARPEFGRYSLSQELHRAGVPVVLGSQFPLTKSGSIIVADSFYKALIAGTDVRVAIQEARGRLAETAVTRHDWLSLVSYMRLQPEVYKRRVPAIALKAELQGLKRVRDDMQARGTKLDLRDAERFRRRLSERVRSLDRREKALKGQDEALALEAIGLKASGYKRMAETIHIAAKNSRTTSRRILDGSRHALEEAQRLYRLGYLRNPNAHWHGVQALGLELALTGRVVHVVELDALIHLLRRLVREKKDDFWACGSLAEALLLSGRVGSKDTMVEAIAAARALKSRARKHKNKQEGAFAIESTHAQLDRYVQWWTKRRGFLLGIRDLAREARQIIGAAKLSPAR